MTHDHAGHRPPAAADKTVIGWREYVSLPEWGIRFLKAKADTGARTSAIDVANLQELPGERVRFTVVVDRTHPDERVDVEAPIFRRTRVKSSFGASHDRLIIMARLQLGPVQKDVELSLVSRKNMLCRMLLGRKALEPDLVVDPARRYIMGRRPRRKRRKERA